MSATTKGGKVHPGSTPPPKVLLKDLAIGFWLGLVAALAVGFISNANADEPGAGVSAEATR